MGGLNSWWNARFGRRSRGEQRTQRLNRLLRTLAAVNPALLGASSEAQLFANICRTLVEQGEFSMAWVGMAEAATDRVRVACQAGFRHGYLENLEIRYDDSPLGRGPTGIAIRSGQIVVNDDTETNKRFAPWRERAREHGYRSSAAIPLRVHGQVTGSLNVYAATPRAFGREELLLLEKLAGDIGLAMERLRGKEHLESSEHELATILRNMQDTYYRTDVDGRIVHASASATHLLGYAPDEVQGQRLADFYVDPDGRAKFLAALQAAGGMLQNYEAELRHRDGTVLWVSTNAQFVRDDTGKVIGVEGTVRNVTERKQAEQALRENEARFRSTLEAMAEGIVVQDAQDRILTCNPAAERILGLTRDQLMGLTSLDPRWRAVREDGSPFLPGEHPSMVTLRTGQPQSNVLMGIHRPDGSLRWISINCRPLQDEGESRPHSVVVSFHDITALRAANSALRESEARYRTIVETAQEGIWTIDAESRTTFVNRKMAEILGYPVEEMQGRLLFDFMDAEGQRIAMHNVARRKQGIAEKHEFKFQRKDGSDVWAELTTTPLNDEHGGYVGALAMVTDITERRRAEQALRDSEVRYRTIVETAQEGIWTIDAGSRVTFVNPKMAEMLGHTPEEMLGRHLFDFMDEEGRAMATRNLSRRQQGVAEQVEIKYRRKDGTVLWAEITATPLTDDHGQYAGSLAMVTDITERRRAAQALREREALLAHSQQVAHIGSFDWNVVTNEVIWSRETYRLFGEDPDHPSADIWSILARAVHPDDRPRLEASMARTREGIRAPLEMRVIRPDGTERTLWTEGEAVHDENGRLLRMVGVLQDITERKRAEQYQRALLEAVPDLMFRIRADGTYLDVKASTDVPMLVAPEQLLGRTTRDVLPSAIANDSMQAIGRALASGQVQSHVYELEFNGAPHQFEARIAPCGPDEVLGMVRDITERKRAEQALRDNERLLQLSQSLAHIGSWQWNLATGEVSWSDEMYRIYGVPHTPEPVTFDRAMAAIHPDDRERIAHEVQTMLADKASNNFECRIVHPDGKVLHVWSRSEVQCAADGSLTRVLGTVQDITEYKRAEQSLLEVARGVSVSSGELFFTTLVEHLARALAADYAFVGALIPDRPDTVRTLAVQADGQPHDNFEYSLAATPCANVVAQGTCAYPRDVQQLFPDDHMLAEMGVHAYVGTPLPGAGGRALGLIVVLYRHPIARDTAVASTLEIFATRAANELERQRAEAQMRKLSSAIEQTADSVVITDRRGRIEYVNPAFEHSTGYSAAEAIGQTPRLVKSGKQGPAFYQKMWQTVLSGEVYSDVLINRRKDGTYYYEEKTITPLKDAAGHVTHFISTGKDVTERMQAQEKLEFMAQHDALTSLPNRALLLDRLSQSIARARWHRRMVAVLFVDLDRFKTINDTLGHEVGDQLLQQLGERFSRSVREGDTVARFGGDEFVILLDDVASAQDIGGVAQKVLDTLKAPLEIGGQNLYITASIGISLFPTDGEDSSTLLKHADIAMYRAKELGKNTYQFYSADMSARAFERLSLETSLRRALERQEFVLHYQPQFDVGTGRIFGVEALLRWQHPDFGLVPPADFISLLEETGLIVPAGEWVLEEAGRQMQAWHTAGYRNLRLAVNLSPRQVQSAGLLATVQQVLDNIPDETGWLELEITEGLLVQQAPALMETFDALRALGVRLAIDDFGTGYSSLSYLRRLPIDTLKVDRSFVRDVPGDADDSAIATTIIAMAQSLRLEVIAEGVENTEQRDFLSAYGCQRMQGYLFARPALAADITRLIAGGGSGSAPA